MEKTRITFNKIIGHTNLILTLVIGILLIKIEHTNRRLCSDCGYIERKRFKQHENVF
jgi:hypothetical protein